MPLAAMPAPTGGVAERLAPELAELGAASGEDAASTTDSDAVPRPAPPAGRWARAALCAAGVATVCVLLALGGAALQGQQPQHRQDAGSEVVSLGMLGALGDLLEGGGKTLKSTVNTQKELASLPGQVEDIGTALYGESNQSVTAHGPLVEALQNGTFNAWLQNESNREMLKHLLKKPNDMQDGNFCEDDEEEHASLCYKKCALITDGTYPFRGTAFSCCRSTPCTLMNSHFQMSSPCSGYDIAGDKAGNGCPHARGACYADEEYHINMCYMKCVLLTNGTHGYRTAAETCCKFKGAYQCMGKFNSSWTSPMFAVGGGEFESFNRSKMTGNNKPHFPVLTEAENP